LPASLGFIPPYNFPRLADIEKGLDWRLIIIWKEGDL